MNALLAALDWIQGRCWSIGFRFQRPCWLLERAWDRQATPYTPAPSLVDLTCAEYAAGLEEIRKKRQP